MLAKSQNSGDLPPVRTNELTLCRPVKGRSLGATVATFSPPIQKAVAILTRAAGEKSSENALFSAIASRIFQGAICEPAPVRLAWFVTNVALLHAIQMETPCVSTFPVALRWFFAKRSDLATAVLAEFGAAELDQAHFALRETFVDGATISLLPYLLEPHGHVTRGQREQDVHSAERRNRKRKSGVFYTPSDVADFMVRELAHDDSEPLTWIDPACGTGIFMREILRRRNPKLRDKYSALDFCLRFLHGIDISALATESAIFILLAHCILEEQVEEPFGAWQLLANNFGVCDATLLDGKGLPQKTLLERDEVGRPTTLRELFPANGAGFDRVIMNPPYSALTASRVHCSLWESYSDLKPGARVNAALAFVEMMWKLASAKGAAAAVVPLSVAASSHTQYRACRKALAGSGGSWECLFFDREPHALFGEDIKTRNAVLFWRATPSGTELATSRMLKWTSAQRPNIFTRARTARLQDDNIERFIPKLGSDIEVSLYGHLKASDRDGYRPPRVVRIGWDSISGLDRSSTIVVGSSAYNFLNVFSPTAIDGGLDKTLSASPLHAVTFLSDVDRNIGFAVLSSRLAFWLWHVQGDGFHVTADFLERLSLWSKALLSPFRVELAGLGSQAWEQAARTKVRSLNGGKVTYSFHCPFDTVTVNEIDKLLLSTVPQARQSLEAVAKFVSDTVSIDGSRRRLVNS